MLEVNIPGVAGSCLNVAQTFEVAGSYFSEVVCAAERVPPSHKREYKAKILDPVLDTANKILIERLDHCQRLILNLTVNLVKATGI